MLISKEKAEQIIEVSNEIYSLEKKRGVINYKKVLELDEKTADYILEQLKTELRDVQLQTVVANSGGKVYSADDEIVMVENYQYIDFIKYDYISNRFEKEILSIECQLYDGEKFMIPKFNSFYGANIYSSMLFGYSSQNTPLFKELKKIELYLKLCIVEDRQVNPYTITDMNHRCKKVVVCMKERTINIKAYEKEIDLLNKFLKLSNAKIISSGYLGGFADIDISLTVLFLESIGESFLAADFKSYQEDPLKLNLVLDYAYKGYFGLTFSGKRYNVTLL